MPRSRRAVRTKCYPSACGVLMKPTVCVSTQATSVCPTSDSPAGWNEEDGRSPSAGPCSTWVSCVVKHLGEWNIVDGWWCAGWQRWNPSACFPSHDPLLQLCLKFSLFPLWKKKCIPFSACVQKNNYFSLESHPERFISPVWSKQLQRF